MTKTGGTGKNLKSGKGSISVNKNVILLIEDEEKLSRTLAEYLELNGYRVLRALNGLEGLSMFYDHMHEVDLILLDIKHIDEQEHIKLTGQTNKNILAMAEKLSDMGKPVWIRHVLVPARSDRDDYLHRLADFIHTLKNVERVEVLPYHTLGVFKWENLGIPYQLEGINPPSAERIKNAEEILAFRK